MSNQIYTETNIVCEQAVLPAAVGIETSDQTGDAPTVPDTGDLPILPEFRERAQAINWRAALSTASLAAFLAAVAGIGCGSGTPSMLKPSPATPDVFDTKGDLWSSNATPPNTIVEFMPNQLLSTGSPPPAVTLSSVAVGNNQTLVAPNGIAFDNLGDLAVVSSATPFSVAGFQKAQLIPTKTGPTSNPFLVGPTTTLNAPAGCNFGPVFN